MLTELKLSNFRIFNDEVTVRFRPITVLIGRNSSGKSSIIKFLLMLQQSGRIRSVAVPHARRRPGEPGRIPGAEEFLDHQKESRV